jgi:antitoxin component YwqK of YwqJK toxin-antitoxin module
MEKYFNNTALLQNTLLPYFCEPESLKSINKKFYNLNYEKYNNHIQPHGIIESYYPETKIFDERITYKNGKFEGLYEKYNMSGILWKRCYYKNDELQGLYELFDYNGAIHTRYNYNKGEKDGICETYNADKKLYAIEKYRNGMFLDKELRKL